MQGLLVGSRASEISQWAETLFSISPKSGLPSGPVRLLTDDKELSPVIYIFYETAIKTH
ncbi:MAG TPA: hypothetical protein VKM36_07940 [Balneolaceae bacterium]|nr:hypothetical protein [Balneolaceae bacterium]